MSPAFEISDVPDEAVSLVIVVDDPDAALESAWDGTTFDHWVLFNIPASATTVSETALPDGTVVGRNGTGGARVPVANGRNRAVSSRSEGSEPSGARWGGVG
ncbi:MAG: YbhB/YbcL family Raf kinase inhibitor-like protein [Acidimicrobiales bacterium]